MFLAYYFIIGVIFSLIYTYDYMKENEEKLTELKATKNQRFKVALIAFVITLIIYPFTIIDSIIRKTKENRRKK